MSNSHRWRSPGGETGEGGAMTEVTRCEALVAPSIPAASGARRVVPDRPGAPGRRPGSAGRRRPGHVVVATAIAVLVALVTTASTSNASTAPVYGGDFPDPDVV